jgi:hypothetical protein
LEYDQDGDMLEIFFGQGPASGAVELADPLILRFDRETGKALSLSILTFSQVIQGTELGPRGFRLSGLESLPDTLREMVVKMITAPPVGRGVEGGAGGARAPRAGLTRRIRGTRGAASAAAARGRNACTRGG